MSDFYLLKEIQNSGVGKFDGLGVVSSADSKYLSGRRVMRQALKVKLHTVSPELFAVLTRMRCRVAVAIKKRNVHHISDMSGRIIGLRFVVL